MTLGEVCAKHILDPEANPAPSLDYRQELPADLTPDKVLMIYQKVWEL